MNPNYAKSLLSQINSVMEMAEDIGFLSSDHSIEDRELQQLMSMSQSVINRLGSADQIHRKHAQEVMNLAASERYILDRFLGILKSLKISIENGYLDNVEALIHGKMFDDFVDMGEHLFNEGYKDAAAVIVGSALESHLRNLCVRNAISTTIKNGIRPKKADQMNNELCTSGVYEKLDLKTVTAWLDLRNKAAHGEYDKYSNDQVRLMLIGVRDFIARHPA